MATIRSKLTVAYAGTLIGSIAMFSLAMFAAGRSNARRDAQRDAQRDVANRAEQALRVLRFAATANESLTVTRDSIVGAQITPRIAAILDGLPDYVIMLDRNDRTLYVSPSLRALQARAPSPPRPVQSREEEPTDSGCNRRSDSDYDRLMCEAIALTPDYFAFPIDVANNDVMLVALAESDPTTLVTRVVVGREVDLTVGWGPATAPRWSLGELLALIFVVALPIIAASVGGAYVIAGRAVEPVGHMINEVEAITDGRSLHRRLPVEATGDELARLAATLNAMIARLETSFSALRRFTADASHELKTPLAVLRADVERAMHTAPASNEQLVALEEALQETTRMADLVDSLLTLARADEGRFDLHREPFALEPLVHEVFETAVILGEDAGLDVSLTAVEDATILGDRIRLRQLFLNLVTNAIKYTSRGGTVEVTVKRRDGEVQFAVRDTGIGIAAADLPYIFERFWRADRARSRLSERGGFGLGLAISQWIAQAHGGTLTVQSRLHRGSTFTVSLPIAAEAVQPAPAAESRAGAGAPAADTSAAHAGTLE